MFFVVCLVLFGAFAYVSEFTPRPKKKKPTVTRLPMTRSNTLASRKRALWNKDVYEHVPQPNDPHFIPVPSSKPTVNEEE